MAVQNGIDSKQGLSPTSSPTFAAVTLTAPLTGANGGTGVNNGASTVTLGANLTTTPANAVTLTTTGATNVTLPTSGTLATTAQLIATPVSLANGGTAAALVDPNADRIMFWDDSAGAVDWLIAGTGLTITGTTITSAVGDVVGPASATTTAMALFNGATGKLIMDSIPTVTSTGSITTSASVAGATLSIDIVNSSNTASSVARFSATVAGSSASDAVYQASINGGQAYAWGVDNSDSDAYVLAASASLGTTNVMRVATSGEINFPLQCAFLAYLASTALNKTGASALYQLGTDALTEVFDQNGDFDTNGTFTAPVTGRYQLSGAALLIGCTILQVNQITLTTSNRSYSTQIGRTATTADFGNSISLLVDMDAADTATISVLGAGEGGNTDDVSGVTPFGTFFSGNLAC